MKNLIFVGVLILGMTTLSQAQCRNNGGGQCGSVNSVSQQNINLGRQVQALTNVTPQPQVQAQEVCLRSKLRQRVVVRQRIVQAPAVVSTQLVQTPVIQNQQFVQTMIPGPVVQGPTTVIPGPVVQGSTTVIPGPVVQGPTTVIPGPVVQSGLNTFSSIGVNTFAVATAPVAICNVGLLGRIFGSRTVTKTVQVIR